jgi:cell division GTPase FtsZ
MAINSSLLETSISGAKESVECERREDLSLYEVNEVAQIVMKAADPEANIIFVHVVDPMLGDHLRVTVVAAGFAAGSGERAAPVGAAAETAAARLRRRSRPQPRARRSQPEGAGAGSSEKASAGEDDGLVASLSASALGRGRVRRSSSK